MMFSQTEFLDKVINDQKYEHNAEFCKAMAHLCYKDVKLSKFIILKILKALNLIATGSFGHLLSLIEELVLIQDQFQRHRLEWIFGFGFLMCLKDQEGNAVYGEQMEGQHVYSLVSGIDSQQRYKGLLKAFADQPLEGAAIKMIESMCKMMMNEMVAKYLAEVPAVNYDAARFTDHMRPFLQEKFDDNKKNMASTGSPETEERLIKTMSMLETYETYLHACPD